MYAAFFHPDDLGAEDQPKTPVDKRPAAQEGAPGPSADSARDQARKKTGTTSDDRRADKTSRAEASATRGPHPRAGGQHWRLETPRGPVHVWIPGGYAPDTAGIALYVHGYYTDVDQAFQDHHLAEQFARSGRNALFVVPEAPKSGRGRVRWTDIGDLVRTVREHTALTQPWGPVVAVGHSGAYRTLLTWLDDRELKHIVLLDGLYRQLPAFRRWLEIKHRENRLTVVAMDTVRWTDPWARDLPYARVLPWVPNDIRDLDNTARQARLLYMHAQYGHMEVVTKRRVIPVMLQTTSLPAVATTGQKVASPTSAGLDRSYREHATEPTRVPSTTTPSRRVRKAGL